MKYNNRLVLGLFFSISLILGACASTDTAKTDTADTDAKSGKQCSSECKHDKSQCSKECAHSKGQCPKDCKGHGDNTSCTKDKHANHDHTHGENCGHKTTKHGDHTDFMHDGHQHNVHGDHVDEHKTLKASNPKNPKES